MSLLSKDDYDDAIQALECHFEEHSQDFVEVKRSRVVSLIGWLKMERKRKYNE